MQQDLFEIQSRHTSSDRVPNDYYPTPANITHELLQAFPEIAGMRVFEPFNGHGAITDVLRLYGCEVVTNDIIQPLENTSGDARETEVWDAAGHLEWVISNPPYFQNIPDITVPIAWSYAKVGVAMLLRLSMLEPCESRRHWNALYPFLTGLGPINPRIKFRIDRNNTDSIASAWFVWTKQTVPFRYIPIIDWKHKTYNTGQPQSNNPIHLDSHQ